MKVAIGCIAVSLVLVPGLDGARAEATSVIIAAGPSAVSSTASVAIAGLGANSIQALPGFPVKAYREGYRNGRVKLSYVVNADGSVGPVEVIDAYPVQVFTRSATSTVSGWRFTPSGATEHRTVEIQFDAK